MFGRPVAKLLSIYSTKYLSLTFYTRGKYVNILLLVVILLQLKKYLNLSKLCQSPIVCNKYDNLYFKHGDLFRV